MSRVYKVASVQAQIVKSNPPALVVCAIGAVSSSGWKNPALSPWVYIVPPADGIYDFDFVATPPDGISFPVITPIAVADVFLDPPRGLKGVRIHATANNLEALIDHKLAAEFPDAGAKPLGDGTAPWPRTK